MVPASAVMSLNGMVRPRSCPTPAIKSWQGYPQLNVAPPLTAIHPYRHVGRAEILK